MSTKLGTLTLDLIAKIGSFTEPMKKAGDTAQRETKRIESSVSSASKAIAGLGAAALAGLTVGSVISMADEYTQMAARIRNATADTAEYDMVQKRLLETANGTYRSLSEAQEVYLSLAGGMKSLGKTTEETLNVADSLSYAFVANAARADQAQSAMDALNKSMAKGKIDADAWISIVSAADNIIADMAKVTGKTEAEIRQLGATGKIALSDLLTTLEVTKDANQALADNMENSLADGLQKVRNSFSAFVGEINVTYGVTSKMAGALSILADNLSVVATAGAVVAVAMGSRMVVEFGKTNAAMLANTIATRNKVLADYERAKADLAATAAMVQSMGPMNAQTAAMMSNAAAAYQKAAAAKAAALSMGTLATAGRGALALFGGPIGLGLTVATVAASYLLMRDNADKSTESLRANNQTVADAVQRYRELDDVQKRAQQAAEKAKLSELAEGYKELTDDLNTNAYALSRHNDFTREQSREVNALIAEFKKTGDLDKFSAAINRLSFVSQDSKDKFNALAGQVRASGNEYKNQKQFVDAITNSLNQNAAAGDNAARGIRNAAEAVAEYTGKLKQQKWDLEFTNAVIDKHGKSAREADLLLQAYRENEKKGIKGVTAEQKELIKGIIAEEEVAAKRNATSAVRSRNRTAAVREETKAQNELNRTLEEQKRIVFEYSSIEDQRKLALEDEINRLRANGMSQYVPLAEARYAEEKKLAEMQFAWEIAEHRLTESQKLSYSFNIKEQEILADAKLTKVQRDAKLQALDEQYATERKMLQINQSKELLETKRHWMTAGDYAREYYAIVREEILNTAEYSPEMKNALVKQANIQQGMEQNAEREGVWENYQDRFGVKESPYQQDMDLLAEAREHMLITEEDYQQRRSALQSIYGSQYGADFAGMMMGLVDSSDWFYRDMAAIQKGFTLYSVAMSSADAIGKAWASAAFPYNLPAVGMTIMETGLLQAAVSALSPAGYADGGFTGYGGKYEPAGIVHKGEGVLTQEEIAALGGPSGFYALRQSIKNGFADGGIALDAPKVLSFDNGQGVGKHMAEMQSNNGQQSQSPQFTIINQIEQDDLVGNYMRGAAGGQIVLNLIKANPSEFKRALGV